MGEREGSLLGSFWMFDIFVSVSVMILRRYSRAVRAQRIKGGA